MSDEGGVVGGDVLAEPQRGAVNDFSHKGARRNACTRHGHAHTEVARAALNIAHNVGGRKSVSRGRVGDVVIDAGNLGSRGNAIAAHQHAGGKRTGDARCQGERGLAAGHAGDKILCGDGIDARAAVGGVDAGAAQQLAGDQIRRAFDRHDRAPAVPKGIEADRAAKVVAGIAEDHRAAARFENASHTGHLTGEFKALDQIVRSGGVVDRERRRSRQGGDTRHLQAIAVVVGHRHGPVAHVQGRNHRAFVGRRIEEWGNGGGNGSGRQRDSASNGDVMIEGQILQAAGAVTIVQELQGAARHGEGLVVEGAHAQHAQVGARFKNQLSGKARVVARQAHRAALGGKAGLLHHTRGQCVDGTDGRSGILGGGTDDQSRGGVSGDAA